MKQLIAIPSEAGTDIMVEVDSTERERPVVRGASAESPLKRAAQTFEAGVTSVVPIAAGLIAHVSNVAEGINEVSIKFGVKFSAELGAIVASTSSDANIEIALKWVKPSKT